ncbi:MAG: DUF6519 domain-containing protein [Geminicoccaceae bacterium]
MTGDISAYLFDPRQSYTSVRLQQGRVITDVDWNENERIGDDRLRRLLADVVCGYGTTNDGFRLVGATLASIEVPTGAGGTAPQATYDVSLAAGSFLLGGHRHVWPAADAETSLSQRDWLQLTGADVAALPAQPGADRTDLVYLEAFEHPVRAVEDRELRERALGGPDTSTRLKAIRRIGVLAGTAADCIAAGAQLRETVTAPAPGDTSGSAHGFDAEMREVLSKARLTVDFTAGDTAEDPCKPRVTGGYLGAENQAIRVQLSAANRFLWAYDNGEPLYRVQIENATPEADGSISIAFLTPPRDPVLFPLQGAIVEILPWDAVLANSEKVAAASGHLARVTASYDPGTDLLRIAPAIPAEMQEWLQSTDRDPLLSPRDPVEERRYFYARIWQPGPEESADLDHQFAPGTPVVLPGTGIELTFSDFGLPGDFWIIAARPNTPDRVVPWRLLDAAAPMGPQRFYAPLGLVHWTVDAAGASATVEDCRHRFRRLCQVESCCTVHVGDGESSHGEVDDLQAAIDLLPPAGGQICLLPGVHEAAARIVERENLVIQGCGPRSRVVAAAGQTEPVIGIEDSRNVVLRDFAIGSETTVLVAALRPERLLLTHMRLEARDRGAVIATAGDGIALIESAITTQPLAAPLIGTGAPLEPAVFLAGDRLRVLRSRIVTQPGDSTALTALGGLQIGGDSTDVEIADNLIEAGNNAGIVLGSIDFVPPDVIASQPTIMAYYAGHHAQPTHASWLTLSDDDCINIDPRPQPPDDPDQPTPPVPISDGPVVDCRIVNNRILDMGASGITVAFWFDPDNEDDAIVTDRLRIDGNEIRGCMRLELGNLAPEIREIVAFGGITLAAGADITIRDNRIVEVGTAHNTPIVGIFVLDGEAVAIQRNHARDNGRVADLESDIEIGWAGGIIVALARPAVDFFAPFRDQVHARQDGAPALIVEDNVVVAREGRALCVIGVGPMVIHGNQLTAHGSNTLSRIPIAGAVVGGFNVTTLALIGLLSRRETRNPLMAYLDILGGAAVAVLNLGLSNEIYLQLLGFSGLGLVDPQQPPGGGFDDDIRLLANGNVQFNDNQVVFDSLSPAITLTLSSVLLLSLDDVSMQDNQCDCDLLFDIVGIHALAIGWSVRMQGNRFKEPLLLNQDDFTHVFLSGLTLGIYNDTTHNQGTHCFVDVGLLKPRITITSFSSGISAELDSNRHLAPEALCRIFLDRRDQIGQAAGFPVAQVGVG